LLKPKQDDKTTWLGFWFFNLTVGELEYDLASKPIDTIAFDLIYVKTQNDFNLEIPGYIPTFSETKIVFAKNLRNSQFLLKIVKVVPKLPTI